MGSAKSQAPVDVRDPFALTPREREVLALIAEGHTNRQIAETLFITENTTGGGTKEFAVLGPLDVREDGDSIAIPGARLVTRDRWG